MDKIVHYIFLLLFGPVLKLVYISSEVEKKVTLFCIISILALQLMASDGISPLPWLLISPCSPSS